MMLLLRPLYLFVWPNGSTRMVFPPICSPGVAHKFRFTASGNQTFTTTTSSSSTTTTTTMNLRFAALILAYSGGACVHAYWQQEQDDHRANNSQHLRGMQQKLGDWEFCALSSECNNGCCSSRYSDDGRLKCTPLNGGFDPTICTTGSAPAPAPTSSSGLLGDWEFCASNSACSNGCCSSAYSDDGQLKCTPLDGGFNPNICTGGSAPPPPAPTGSGSLLGDWELCASNSACSNGCCSSMYSNDGQLKCTPLDGGFNPDVCMGGSPPVSAPTGGGSGCIEGGGSERSIWPNNGKGLELEILNALDDTWQGAFAAAIGDWENGDPDALTLMVTRGQVDTVCEQQIDGLMKVCNRDFGDTGWRGINVNWFLGGQIVAAVTKMNDFYLRDSGSVERQYIMCHEVGHGFGLPHTDESFDNPSLGECMDYGNAEENLHPGVFNYQRLASWYGTVGCRRGLDERSPSVKHGDQRTLSESLQLEYEEAIAQIEQLASRRALREGTLDSLWELLDDHPMGSSYVRTLGEDYQIEVHLLHAFPKD